MGIRTYRARSMADAIDAVQRELGRDAIILHTRNYKIGGFLGFGGRPVVEVTASPASVVRDRQRTPSRQHGSRTSEHTQPSSARGPGSARPAASQAGNGSSDTASTDRGRAAADEAPAGDPMSPQRRMALLEQYTALASARAGLQQAAPAHGLHAVPAGAGLRLGQAGPSVEAPKPGADRPGSDRPDGAPLDAGRLDRAGDGRAASGLPGSTLRVRSDALAMPAGTVEQELRSLRQMLGKVLHTQHAGVVSGASMGGPLAELYAGLIEAEIERSLADQIVSQVRDGLSSEDLGDAQAVHALAVAALAERIPTTRGGRGRSSEGPLTIALVGPTGVGKTTTIAKLAATYKLRRQMRVGLITTDTFRIAAVEQLRTYASIISVPMRVVMSPAEMASACRAMADCDVVLIDTAGRSPRDGQRVEELSAYLAEARPRETHLVLSATAGSTALRRAASGFAAVRPDRVLFTKLDEAESLGVMVSLLHELGLPLSFVTTGQEVPDHIEPGRAERLARLVLSSLRPGAEAAERARPAADRALAEAACGAAW
ncbi:MAG: hypothetical protein KatS3mg103_0205 [Phycisphaerales bacterium]|nr:MAG: hypothetical protein KatS3mg103_0205 [Phycisphaerales bacterium]